MKLNLELDHEDTKSIASNLKVLWAAARACNRSDTFELVLNYRVRDTGEVCDPQVLPANTYGINPGIHLAAIGRNVIGTYYLRLHPLFNESYFSKAWLESFKKEVETYGK